MQSSHVASEPCERCASNPLTYARWLEPADLDKRRISPARDPKQEMSVFFFKVGPKPPPSPPKKQQQNASTEMLWVNTRKMKMGNIKPFKRNRNHFMIYSICVSTWGSSRHGLVRQYEELFVKTKDPLVNTKNCSSRQRVVHCRGVHLVVGQRCNPRGDRRSCSSPRSSKSCVSTNFS